MKYFKHFAHCGNKLKQQQHQQQHPSNLLCLPSNLSIVTVKHTNSKKTRPIINHRHHHPSRSSTTRKHENQNKAKALYKISLDNIFQVIVRVRVRNHHHRERERIEVENLEWNLLKLLHFEWQAQCPQFRQ